MYSITQKLEVYDRAGTSVILTLTSISGGTNPYLSTIPNGDGQEINPLTGERRAGRYTGLIVDAITSGTTRIVTSNLEDSGYRQQLMRRKAVLSQVVDGATTIVLCAGKLTRLRLANTAEYEYEVTDDTVLAANQKLFTPKTATVTLSAGASGGATTLSCTALPLGLAKNTTLNFGGGKTAVVSTAAAVGATSFSVTAIPVAASNGDYASYRESVADFVTRWPKRGCAFGGPVMSGFLNLPTNTPWLFRLQKSSTGVFGPQLRFLSGYGPADGFRRQITNVNDPSIAPATNDRVGPYSPSTGTDLSGVTEIPSGAITTFDQAERSAFAKSLLIEVLSQNGSTSYGYFLPSTLSFLTDKVLLNVGQPASGGAPATDPGVWLASSSAAALPSYGTTVRARAFTVNPSEVSPVYVEMHPVTLLTTLLSELGYSYDSSSATTMTQALGADLLYPIRITEPQDGIRFITDELLGPFGIGIRMTDDGSLEFFSLRILNNAAPSTTITDADVVLPDEGGAGDAFSISESTAIAKVVVEMNSYTIAGATAVERPPDGVVVRPIRIERTNGDPGVVGDRVHQWTLTGMVRRNNGQYYAETTYWDSPVKEVFDRFGRGVIECELPLLYGGSGTSLKIGDEAVVAVSQFPNKNKRYGDDNSVGGRAMQLVRLTRQPWGALAKFADSGPNANAYGTVPTVSLAASGSLPNTIAQLTITNAATLNAAGAGARVRLAIVAGGGSAPASTDFVDAVSFPVGQIPTSAFDLPGVSAGYKVYATARAEPVSSRPSNYATAANATLTAYTAPSAVVAAASGSDGTSATATWTVGTASLRTEIYVRETSGTSANDDTLVESLQPGTDRYTLLRLNPSTAYTVSVRHIDPTTGDVTAKATGTVTTGAAPLALTTPIGERAFVGQQDVAVDVPDDPAVYGIASKITDFPIDVEAYEAVETSVGSGSYSDFAYVNRVPGRQGTPTPIYSRAPRDGRNRQLKARAVRPGMHRGAAAMMAAEMAALDVSEAASLYAGTHTSSFGSVVTVLPYSVTAVQKTTKTVRLSAAGVTWFTTTFVNLQLVNATLTPATKGVAIATMLVVLPVGATVTGWRFRSVSRSANASIQVEFYRAVDDAAGLVDVDTNIDGTNVFRTNGTRALSQVIDGATFYVQVHLATTLATAAADAALAWVEFDYAAPYLDTSI